jgi:trehalose 6-phosphate phosphatase
VQVRVIELPDLHDALHEAWELFLSGAWLARPDRKGLPPTRPFHLPADYRRYVDGKPRYAGVKRFLQSRGIAIPDGEPSDDPAQETVCGLGNRKNTIFLELLKMQGVEVFDSTVALIRALRE